MATVTHSKTSHMCLGGQGLIWVSREAKRTKFVQHCASNRFHGFSGFLTGPLRYVFTLWRINYEDLLRSLFKAVIRWYCKVGDTYEIRSTRILIFSASVFWSLEKKLISYTFISVYSWHNGCLTKRYKICSELDWKLKKNTTRLYKLHIQANNIRVANFVGIRIVLADPLIFHEYKYWKIFWFTSTGLRLVLNIETKEYIENYMDAPGIRLVIHQRGTLPFPEEEGITLNPNYETSIGMRMVCIY